MVAFWSGGIVEWWHRGVVEWWHRGVVAGWSGGGVEWGRLREVTIAGGRDEGFWSFVQKKQKQ